MMSDLKEMADAHQQDQNVSKFVNQDGSTWHSIENPWIDQRIMSEIERLNLYQRMHNGED